MRFATIGAGWITDAFIGDRAGRGYGACCGIFAR